MATTAYGSGSMNVELHESTDLIDHRGFSEPISETDYDESDSADDKDAAKTLDYSEYCCTWKEYFSSWRFVELVLCVVPFLAIGIYYEYAEIIPRMRPIPFQHVMGESTNTDGGGFGGTNGVTLAEGSNGGYESYTNTLWNPVNNEKSFGDTISHNAYMILMGLCPWLLQLFLAWFLAPSKQRSSFRGVAHNFYRWDVVHRTTCVYFVGIGLTDAVINCVKFYVGYLRPIFLERCQPYYDDKHSRFRCIDEHNPDTLDARVSFPSNHSGWSFCGMMLLSMYLERRFGLSSISNSSNNSAIMNGPLNIPAATKEALRYKDSKKQQWQRRDQQAIYRLLSLICYSPVLLATFIAASRVVDNKHFPADIICGAVLGGSIASLVFGIWFPQ